MSQDPAAPSTPAPAPASNHGGAASSTHRQLHVALGARSYDILIGAGLLTEAGTLIRERLGKRRTAIVTDRNVAAHHLETLSAALEAAGLSSEAIVLPPGEATKSFRELETLCEDLLELGLERGDLVIAFGGGVVGDLVGFAASILRRGVRFVQIPTTLLAQVDSSVGGKTGINTPQGKNLIGTFAQPALVLADMAVLKTLDPREFRAGYAEVVKYGLINDADFFAWLEANHAAVFAGDQEARAQAIEVSCRAKAAIVAADEREAGQRALLNLGHTFGHALEAWAGYSGRLIHGEGVAIGMALAMRLSVRLGLCPAHDCDRAIAHLEAVGLPVHIADIPGDLRPDPIELVRLMGQDKKVKGGRLTFVLSRGIGRAFLTQDVEDDVLKNFLKEECK